MVSFLVRLKMSDYTQFMVLCDIFASPASFFGTLRSQEL